MDVAEGFDLADAATRARWTASTAEQVLRAFAESGLSRREFAERHGLHEQRLYNWQRRLGGGESAQSVQFRELPRSPVAGADARVEVVLRSGVLLRIPSSFDASALGKILELLDRAR